MSPERVFTSEHLDGSNSLQTLFYPERSSEVNVARCRVSAAGLHFNLGKSTGTPSNSLLLQTATSKYISGLMLSWLHKDIYVEYNKEGPFRTYFITVIEQVWENWTVVQQT